MRGFSIELASAADAAGLQAIYECDQGFSGPLAVKYTRGADPYTSLAAEGDQVVIPVVREQASQQLVGMGACVIRQAWVNGEKTTVGYLTGLKALPEFRGWVRLIPQVYAFLRQHTPQVACYYTTILASNNLARKMLEKPRRNMPEYRFVADYVTHCFTAQGARPRLSPGSLAELAEQQARWNLSSVGLPPGLGDEAIRVLRDPAGSPLAWCAVLDTPAKSYRITGYQGGYRWVAKLPVHWLGYPRMPKVGQQVKQLSVAALGGVGDDPGLITTLLRGVANEFSNRDFIMVGFAGEHPYAAGISRLRGISYSSRLYTVHFDEYCSGLDGGTIGLDVGLL